ncbi:MAG: hypothetical protein B6U89_01205 [Desulfurococcales archaeon ex4484_58]|nr:MAG: hypothetical protein B6U89_01205 [Desulfurococcales archaeon ex4484_58]
MGKCVKKGILKILLLSIIIKHQKIHGYRIYKELMDLSMDRWKPSIGTLYRLLNELAQENLVKKEETFSGNRRIVYYEATNAGVEEFLKVCDAFFERTIIGLDILLPTLMKLRKTGLVNEMIIDKVKSIEKLIYLHTSGK